MKTIKLVDAYEDDDIKICNNKNTIMIVNKTSSEVKVEVSKTDIKHAKDVYNIEPYGKILIKASRNVYHVWCTVKSNNKVIFNTVDNRLFKREKRSLSLDDIGDIIDFVLDILG